ncbi:hypothetical protein GlitD10_2482 [Gloeomargarita lithophora Alchichica-D10]|uniref:DUF1816 domain-containing protein n=1 Tax=Gloeomargarita lithophora Alchichica-D10 TaxID=1188229 RepID=A0A1J0AFY5_9CYAN|nr:DUF1816 domain-containing protein [Gloeomargarita lithophora]APB34819.1 hypothetical protein GlitD10_2482 [Gloeomargarita lithophora Alchichica-D10]
MKFKDSFRELFTSVLERVGLAWWVKICTTHPPCAYYFGPFATEEEAVAAQPGYLEDLLAEQAEGITWEICQARPQVLTVEDLIVPANGNGQVPRPPEPQLPLG